MTYSDFSQMPEDDLDATPVSGLGSMLKSLLANPGVVPPTPKPVAAGSYIEDCTKCRGSGTYGRVTALGHSYCTQCKGAGKIAYKTSRDDRLAKRDAAKARKERKLDDQLAAFEAEFPLIRDWWTGNDFGFAVSMRDAVRKFGSLTDKQLAAVDRCVDADLRRKDAKLALAAVAQVELAAAPVLNVEPMLACFQRAHDQGIKTPKMRADGMQFSRAPDSGRNAGAVYVKDGDTYLGKIVAGRFAKSFDCTPDMAQRVLEVCSDPLTAVVAFGRKFGRCSICARDLSDPLSIERGIGPDCYARMFG